ncbi:MAG: MmgE/PrpD family protein [Pseudolabrys sp.]
MQAGTNGHSADGAAGRTKELADFVSALTPDTVPPRALGRAAELIVDHLAVSLHSLDLPWSKIIADYVSDEGGRADATLYGGGRVPARMAALANGTIAHGIELDDTHDESCSHPGAVVIPAALAVAEMTNASGRDLLTAIIAGYEVQARAGASLTGDLMLRGFHPTALAGVFGASTAAAHLLHLSSDQRQSMWGLAVSMASGVMQFTQDPQGTMVKRIHAGYPAHNGVLAAQLAARGFRGPRQALDGKYGFAHVFSPKPDERHLNKNLGQTWAIDNISVKFYACCRLFHAMVDAIGDCRKDQSWSLNDIAAIEAFGPRMMSEGHMQYRPESVMSAQYSLPFSIAAALKLDPRDPRSFNDEAMRRKDVLALADVVTASVDPALESKFPAKYAGGIRFRLKNGRVVEETLLDSFGTPAKPVDRAGIQGKFRTLTDGIVAPDRQSSILATALGLEGAKSMKPLTELLGRGVAIANGEAKTVAA